MSMDSIALRSSALYSVSSCPLKLTHLSSVSTKYSFESSFISLFGRSLSNHASFYPRINSYKQLRRTLTPISAASVSSSISTPAADVPSSSPSASDIVWPAIGAFVSMFAMSYVDKLVKPMGLVFTIAPFGAVCAVLFAAPATPAAKKYNMFVAHIGCAAIGIGALALFGPGWLARGVALAASIAFMQLTGSMHPPAAGLPLLFIDVPMFQQLKLWYLIFPSAVGCVILCAVQELVLLLRRSCRF
ncbi:hypothetical protein KP509_07G054800 [Ceratopteris richardii]|uniref:HPP transmembrane region domain-containing protein n=1 Tax=Ceratopteris richardii TaxID=49495 RepID=A0A8T2ULB3_CERRI|nr:hypothetical protein KP509_07G054800 [Ceratopteris richardii]